MRYLKKYTLFERVSKETNMFESIDIVEDYNQLISILQDLTLDIKDKDLRVDVIKLSLLGIKIRIAKNEEVYGGRFNLYDIKDEIIQIVDFMDSEGWVIDYAGVVDASGIHNVLIRDNMIINQYSGEEVNYLVGEFNIKLKKSE